jgi:outer membrane protein OmpA-like peptidoglycan-associated protein
MQIYSSTYPQRVLLGALLALLAACTTQSGPTYTLNSIVVPNRTTPTYRVVCGGLLESSKSCMRVAEETCKDKPVTVLEAVDGVRSAASTEDPRELTFMCGKPAEPQAAVQPQPQPQPQPEARPVPLPQRQLLLQGDANFATDSAVLTGAAKANLDRFVRENEGVNFKRITIVGYTDSTGTRARNQKLSEARAQSVLQYLRSHGVSSKDFIAEGAGQDNPVASNSTVAGRTMNRRVEVRVVAM